MTAGTATARHGVLIVEDDRWFAESAVRTLAARGITARWVADAQAAADAVADTPPALILLDFFLPSANGLQLLHELRGYDDTADVPVVLISSAAGSLDRADCAAYGVIDVMDKTTMTPSTLIAAVTQVLQR